MTELLPIIAITMGDPAGIGPEVTARALTQDAVWACCRPVVVGDLKMLRKAAAICQLALDFHPIQSMAQARYNRRAPDVLDLANIDLNTLKPGVVSAGAGLAAVAYIAKAVELARTNQVVAIATGPINKAALKLAHVPYIGHTEMISDLMNEHNVTTMLATEGLRVVHVTRHLAFKDIAAEITQENVLETVRITDAGMRQMGIKAPRLAVAALNPHGGDDGLMGREEIETIGPAVAAAQAAGILASGPIPADSVFFRAIRGEFDAVVCMYHDQGHIAIKTHGFDGSVTVTLGLSIVRTSVDHGTAFDIAWKGLASDEGMVAALVVAAQLVEGRDRP
jgi:4-phospho-D-threonate 3-dehydrogenase / 4-phospho-D-erythronate 3-dehydrogenase